MLRQISLISLLVFLLSALVLLDFKAAQRAALADQRTPPEFGAHLLGIGGRLVARIGEGFGQEGTETSERLSLMLPAIPEGWESRTATKDDRSALLAKRPKDDEPQAVSLIEGILNARGAGSDEVAQRVYARKNLLVVFKLVRQPDEIFIDPARLRDLDALIAANPQGEWASFMRVRGLDIVELVLPEKIRARVFTAGIGGQLRLWVASSDRLSDDDLLPFFETLDVAAMNAAVRAHEDGVGAVPVIVLASELKDEALAAYEADRQARERASKAILQDARAALATLPETNEDREDSQETGRGGCTVTASGVTICLTEG